MMGIGHFPAKPVTAAPAEPCREHGDDGDKVFREFLFGGTPWGFFQADHAKIWGATTREQFVDLVDDIVGIAEYIIACQEADVVQVL
jgi:hypothetical protein